MSSHGLADTSQHQATASTDCASDEEQSSPAVVQLAAKPRSNRAFRFSTRTNSDYKWKDHDNGATVVVGALEIQSEPVMNYKCELKKSFVLGREDMFDSAYKIWKKHNLRTQFIQTCDQIPPSTFCCGLLHDDEDTIRNMLPVLNEWAYITNEEYFKGTGYKLDCFHWTWNNVSGKAKTNILLVRFLQQDSKYKSEDSSDNNLKKHSAHKSSGTARSTPRSTPKNSPAPPASNRKRITP